MASRTARAGALPHALLDSCQRPIQIRGSRVAGASANWSKSMMRNDVVLLDEHLVLFARGYILSGCELGE